MLNRLKNTISNIRQQDGEAVRRTTNIEVLNSEEVKTYKNAIERLRQTFESIESLSMGDLTELVAQALKKGEQPDNPVDQDGHSALSSHIQQVKSSLDQVSTQILQMQTLQVDIKNRVLAIESDSLLRNGKEADVYEREIGSLKKDLASNKEILGTITQQNQLYSKEIKEIHERNKKLERELGDYKNLVSNLREEKNVLLEMRNSDSSAQIPEVEALKMQLSEFEKRLALERVRVEQKEKQIEGLRKRMEDDRESLEKIADELKEKELKSKKILDKYERSKTEVRKFREEKTEFIKQLNLEAAKTSEQLSREKRKSELLSTELATANTEIETLRLQVSKNVYRKIELESCQVELVQVRNQLHETNTALQYQKEEYEKLREANDQLHGKRKQLLEALEKPVNHELKTLAKILRALDKLYKDYITTVFQEGNVVGFESKIMYIITNVQEIKEDLML